ncbi:PH domain-containing protein [Bacillus rhizoplanae]|uniref:PH domain-containing protein n=1 Tax=Bacillus rhizoplanae TaxID=2880966 RepID=UPI003D1C17BA
MQANLETIKQNLDNRDEVLANIRCSLEVFIFRQTIRPGILVATKNKLIFCADSIVENELTEIYEYEDIGEITRKKGIMNEYISIKHKEDVVRFKQLMSANVEDFIAIIKAKISK